MGVVTSVSSPVVIALTYRDWWQGWCEIKFNKKCFPKERKTVRKKCILAWPGNLTRGGTQLSFWYRCATRRAANGGLKERVGTKNRGFQKELIFCKK